MAIRSRLRGLLFSAWQECIEKDYSRQLINSERSLQAYFWSRLNSTLPTQLRTFVEPRIELRKENRSLTPDIVICNTRHVICVVEIKYLPRAFAAHDKDVKSLASIARNRRSLSVANWRFRGPKDRPKNYGFADNLLCVWAGVHRPPKEGSFWTADMLSRGTRVLEGRCRFMQLHAETDWDSDPVIFSLAN